MTGNAFDEMLYMLFAMTHFFGWGVFADTSAAFGYFHGTLVTVLAYGASILGIHLAAKYVRAGHIQYGWRSGAYSSKLDVKDPMDDYLAFQLLQKKMELAQQLTKQVPPKSIFQWEHTSGTKPSRGPLMFQFKRGPKGLSQEGKQLFGFQENANPAVATDVP